MDHKAFLFDTEKFHVQIEPVLQKCCLPKGEQYAVQYIGDNYSLLKSPYTGDELDEDWEDELEANTLQEYLDFILTACYDPDEEIGLGYDWEDSLKAIGSIETKQDEDCHSWVLGSPLVYGKITIDPGAMGLGIISIERH